MLAPALLITTTITAAPGGSLVAAAPGGSLSLVHADLLIPGEGAPVRDAALVYNASSGAIVFSGPRGAQPALPARTPKVHVPVIMPGLFDTHTHFGGTSCAEIAPDLATFSRGRFPRTYEQFACALRMALESICAGVTSVREVGSAFSQPLAHALASGLYLGPHFHYASFALGMTGGHADEQYEPLAAVDNAGAKSVYANGYTGLCDGPAECVKRTREQLRAQADVIKVMATGGVLSAFDSPTDQELSRAEVSAIVSEAARARRVVAAHAHGALGIVNAIESGVHTIEHGSYGNATIWRLAKAKGVLYTPTIAITQTFNGTRPAAYNERQWAKGVEVLQHHSASVRAALREGVTITTGTDCPFGSCAHVGSELVYLHELFGVPPLDAIRMGTANAPLALGELGMAPRTGRLAAGYVADMIGLSESPLERIRVLAEPRSVTHVWKAGRLVKHPRTDVCAPVADGLADPRRAVASASSALAHVTAASSY